MKLHFFPGFFVHLKLGKNKNIERKINEFLVRSIK